LVTTIAPITSDELALRTIDLFDEVFGYSCSHTTVAPGRVNLIGEHIDYNHGYVLPFGINKYTSVSIGSNNKVNASNTDVLCRVHSANQSESYYFDLATNAPPSPGTWESYIFGVVVEFHQECQNLTSFDVVIDSTVPMGSGLSSSAALEVAFATALEAQFGHSLSPLDKIKLCQRAEHTYAGVPCGIMDQYASTYSRSESLLFLDCVSLEARNISVENSAVAFLVMDTSVQHQLAEDEYGKRRRECEEALSILKASSWRSISREIVEKNIPSLGPVLTKRAQHVVGEIERCQSTVDAVENCQWDFVGKLMYESHNSLRDLFEVSCSELDSLVDIANELGTDEGVLGSRMTGGGFGGSTISLVAESNASAVAKTMEQEYLKRTGINSQWFLTRPMDGAHVYAEQQANVSP